MIILIMNNYQSEYINYISNFAINNKIHIWLGGSHLYDNASLYSDVDIIVFSEYSNIRNLIYDYDEPLYISYTTNPYGILIVIYKNGVAVDLEIIKEIDVSYPEYFHKENIKNLNYIRDTQLCKALVLSDDKQYNMSRLFHRSLIKYLSGKKEIGISIFNEILSFMGYKTITDSQEYNLYFLDVLNDFKSKYNMQLDYYNLLCELADNL